METMGSEMTDWAGNTTGVARFFDDSVAAFATFEAATIAERYGTPYLACPDGGAGPAATTMLMSSRWEGDVCSRR
jgi:hypothetical protein